MINEKEEGTGGFCVWGEVVGSGEDGNIVGRKGAWVRIGTPKNVDNYSHFCPTWVSMGVCPHMFGERERG